MKDDIRLNGIAVNHITGQKINTCKSSEIYNIQNAICFFLLTDWQLSEIQVNSQLQHRSAVTEITQ